jgi:hypothetical protein
MAELGAFFGNPNIQRQGARARALAGQRDVNTLADPRTYAIVQGLLGTAPDQMGLSVLNPDYEKIRKAAEPAFALGLLGQAAPLLAPMTKGLPVGASIQNVGKSASQSIVREGNPIQSAVVLIGDRIFTGRTHTEAFNRAIYEGVIRKEGNKFIYPKDAEINSDLFMTKDGQIIDRLQASKMFDIGASETAIKEGLMQNKPASSMSVDSYIEQANKIKKQKESKSAPRQEALDTAQRNAALPVEEGGLGLPKDNTPEMRAEAMGHNVPAYHGTTVWEAEDGRKLGDIQAFNRLASTEIVGRKPSIDQMGIWASDRPDELGAGMYSGSQGAIYPLLLRMENPKTTSFEQMARTASNLSTNKALGATEVPRVSDVEPYRQRLKEQGYDSLILRAKEGSPYTEFVDQTGYVLLEPSQVRSRFAAFDPMRRNEADILAGVLPLGLLADEEQRKKLYELMPSLLGE